MVCVYGFCDDFVAFEVCFVPLFGEYVAVSGVSWRKYWLADGSKFVPCHYFLFYFIFFISSSSWVFMVSKNRLYFLMLKTNQLSQIYGSDIRKFLDIDFTC